MGCEDGLPWAQSYISPCYHLSTVILSCCLQNGDTVWWNTHKEVIIKGLFTALYSHTPFLHQNSIDLIWLLNKWQWCLIWFYFCSNLMNIYIYTIILHSIDMPLAVSTKWIVFFHLYMGKRHNLKLTWQSNSSPSPKNQYGLEWAVPQGTSDNHAEELSHTLTLSMSR